jgi:hypothetical protein
MNGGPHLRARASSGSMDTGAQETGGITGYRDDGIVRPMQEGIGVIRTMTDTRTAGTITKGIGIVRIRNATKIATIMRMAGVKPGQFAAKFC